MKIKTLLFVFGLFLSTGIFAQLFDGDTAYTFMFPNALSKEAKLSLKNTGGLNMDITYQIVRDDMISKKSTWTEGQFCDCQTCYASWDYVQSENCSSANGSPLTANDQYDFTWKINPGGLSNLNSDTAIFVLAAQEVNSGVRDTAVFIAVKDPSVTSIAERIETEQSFEILPNPVHTTATLKLFTRTKVAINLSIIDVLGNEVASEQFSKNVGDFEKEISFEELNSGIYFVNLFVDGERFTKKVIVE